LTPVLSGFLAPSLDLSASGCHLKSGSACFQNLLLYAKVAYVYIENLMQVFMEVLTSVGWFLK
jgi:hypothetical protein